MLRHTGTTRTDTHNLQLASLFSFVAGLVNVTGFLSVHYLTTNVTGHFAYFAEKVMDRDTGMILAYALFILAFFCGAFLSSFIKEFAHKEAAGAMYTIPVLLEACILIICSFLPMSLVISNAQLFACALLFAMGIQNALVSSVSNSVVRTTHLTGLFTDLGLDAAQLCFRRMPHARRALVISIKLRLTIIGCFFLGCIVGGLAFFHVHLYVLLLAAACLLFGLLRDASRE